MNEVILEEFNGDGVEGVAVGHERIPDGAGAAGDSVYLKKYYFHARMFHEERYKSFCFFNWL